MRVIRLKEGKHREVRLLVQQDNWLLNQRSISYSKKARITDMSNEIICYSTKKRYVVLSNESNINFKDIDLNVKVEGLSLLRKITI